MLSPRMGGKTEEDCLAPGSVLGILEPKQQRPNREELTVERGTGTHFAPVPR